MSSGHVCHSMQLNVFVSVARDVVLPTSTYQKLHFRIPYHHTQVILNKETQTLLFKCSFADVL